MLPLNLLLSPLRESGLLYLCVHCILLKWGFENPHSYLILLTGKPKTNKQTQRIVNKSALAKFTREPIVISFDFRDTEWQILNGNWIHEIKRRHQKKITFVISVFQVLLTCLAFQLKWKRSTVSWSNSSHMKADMSSKRGTCATEERRTLTQSEQAGV